MNALPTRIKAKISTLTSYSFPSVVWGTESVSQPSKKLEPPNSSLKREVFCIIQGKQRQSPVLIGWLLMVHIMMVFFLSFTYISKRTPPPQDILLNLTKYNHKLQFPNFHSSIHHQVTIWTQQQSLTHHYYCCYSGKTKVKHV